MTAENIAKALGGHRAGATWMARCPVHDDRAPSLSISSGKDGKVLVRCHAGCEQRDVITALPCCCGSAFKGWGRISIGEPKRPQASSFHSPAGRF
jgi:GTP cyclohydrolase II